jgi:hypothetical protein
MAPDAFGGGAAADGEGAEGGEAPPAPLTRPPFNAFCFHDVDLLPGASLGPM